MTFMTISLRKTAAAHAADIAKGIPGARDQDDRMAKASRKLDWDAQWLEQALDPDAKQ